MSDARMLILAPEREPRARVRQQFATHGIESERIAFVPYQTRPAFLPILQLVDISLDTLPYNGHTTSLDSFWMGVPVVSLVGRRWLDEPASRRRAISG